MRLSRWNNIFIMQEVESTVLCESKECFLFQFVKQQSWRICHQNIAPNDEFCT